ncbi:MAG: shikimate dehydrogenase, partial [Pseudomonadota bacterium]|nr:shikimate dehydrogenase [Pseudomonadota bacterium]
IVVNTTPLGQVDQPEFRVPLDGLAPHMAVADVSVGAADTRLMAEARAVGCAVADGAGMLQHQLIPVFERWFGVRPDITDQSRAAVQKA